MNKAILVASAKSRRAIKADKLCMFFPVPEEIKGYQGHQVERGRSQTTSSDSY